MVAASRLLTLSFVALQAGAIRVDEDAAAEDDAAMPNPLAGIEHSLQEVWHDVRSLGSKGEHPHAAASSAAKASPAEKTTVKKAETAAHKAAQAPPGKQQQQQPPQQQHSLLELSSEEEAEMPDIIRKIQGNLANIWDQVRGLGHPQTAEGGSKPAAASANKHSEKSQGEHSQEHGKEEAAKPATAGAASQHEEHDHESKDAKPAGGAASSSATGSTPQASGSKR